MNRPFQLALFTAFLAAPSLRAQNVSLVSVSSAGEQGNNVSYDPALSADGRYVVFMSAANNLVPGDTNSSTQDIFVRDRLAGTTALVNVSSSGAQADGDSGDPSISADGRFVVFRSLADNLVPNDTNHLADVFVHDTLSGSTTRVSVDSAGTEGNGTASYRPSISADGRYVAFQTSSSNLVPGANGGIFVHDRQTGTTMCASVDSSGTRFGLGVSPSISADGRFVAFDSGFGNLVPNDLNQTNDVFVHDMMTGVTERVSVNSAGAQGRGESINCGISADGRFVAFQSRCAALVPGGIPRVPGVFVHDRQTGITTRASVSSTGVSGDSGAQFDLTLLHEVSISADGRFVCFVSGATNLVPADTNHAQDVFVHDNTTGATARVDVDTAGAPAPSGSDFSAAISADGTTIVFSSTSHLVPPFLDPHRNVFAIDNPFLDVGTSVCAGDGTGTACPCGNFGAPGHGCSNSSDGQGARLTGNGVASIANDTLVLAGTGLPGSSGIYLQGTVQLGGGVAFGDGLRCVGGSVVRLGVVAAIQHASEFPPSGTSISMVGNVLPGDVRYYQLWYRDAGTALCTSSHFNLTNALQVQWGP